MILLYFGIISFLMALYMYQRNLHVYELRKWLIEEIHECAMEDIAHGKDYKWRYDVFNNVSYDEMMVKFWKPLNIENWWNDITFLYTQKEIDNA